MSDHLLRLAKIVETFTFWAHVAPSVRADMQSLVRDIEAAGIDMPPVPERRTITRKQYEMAVGRISSSRDELSASVCALICLREWDLTVEDA